MSESNPAAWAARGMSILPGLQPRPQHHICDKKSAIENINSTSKALFVSVRNCHDTEVNVIGKVGKITAENGIGLKINVSDHVIGGTLEFIRCQNVALHLGKDAEIPTLQIDDSSNVKIHIQAKSQIECVYYIRTKSINLLLENQTDESESGLSLQYEIPTAGSFQCQHVAHWSSANVDATFITEPVVRDGIYPTTAEMKRAAEEREETAMVRMADMLVQGITITKADKNNPGASSKPTPGETEENLDDPD